VNLSDSLFFETETPTFHDALSQTIRLFFPEVSVQFILNNFIDHEVANFNGANVITLLTNVYSSKDPIVTDSAHFRELSKKIHYFIDNIDSCLRFKSFPYLLFASILETEIRNYHLSHGVSCEEIDTLFRQEIPDYPVRFPFTLNEVVIPSSIYIQLRFPELDLHIDSEGEKHTIFENTFSFSNDLHLIHFQDNFPDIAAVYYNIVKNSANALSRKLDREASGSRERSAYSIKTHVLNQEDTIAILIEDTADGIDIHKLLTNIKKLFERKPYLEAYAHSVLGESNYRQLHKWVHPNTSLDHFAISGINIGDISMLYCLPEVSLGEASRPSGSGLGLYGSNRIVSNYGGKLKLTTKSQGGACVGIFLPESMIEK
jgi:hypothetical protein